MTRRTALLAALATNMNGQRDGKPPTITISHLSIGTVNQDPPSAALTIQLDGRRLTFSEREIMDILEGKFKPDQCPVCGTMAEPFRPVPGPFRGGMKSRYIACSRCRTVFEQEAEEPQ